MKHVARHVGRAVLFAVVGAVAWSCASAPPKQEEKWPEATRSDWEHKDDPCKEKGGAPRQCSSNADCCEGFTCSIDPERSRVVRYCIEG